MQKFLNRLFFVFVSLMVILQPAYARARHRGSHKSYIIEFAMLGALALYCYVKDRA